MTLNRDGQVLFGSVGSWPAIRVALAGGDVDVMVDVVNGHFLAPPSLAGEATAFRLTLLDARDIAIGTIEGLNAPGSAVPTG